MRVIRREGGPAWLTVGLLLAGLVLVLDLIFAATGQVDLKVGLMIAGLALARIL